MYRSLQIVQATTRALSGTKTQACAGQFQRAFASKSASDKGFIPTAQPDPEESAYDQENALEGKRTRDSIHAAFESRAMASIRYEYFAQRAELEAEMEAASSFRSLTEVAKQQAMGYLELMEEYGDAHFGSTLENVDISAEEERKNADTICKNNAVIAAEEELPQIEEWFDDMADAGSRAAERLELLTSMMDAEMMEGDDFDVEGGNDVPEKVKG